MSKKTAINDLSELSYTDANNELTQIVRDIEQGETTVDELALKVQRAKELVSHLKMKLRKTEEDVNQILKELGE
jgi:exodeoxyribonuclease VII small subunit